ncbi:MerR family transcriptional regulator [Streptomyces sp. AJS327]|nr:MerR family transcriptional regulator [Streptomyces sp. AJS327]
MKSSQPTGPVAPADATPPAAPLTRSDVLGIGALAARFGLAPHVLRHWESVGLLHPGRDAAGRRRYGADDLSRVAMILIAKRAGLGLDAIRSLSTSVDRAARRETLRPAAEELRSGIAAAQASLRLIEGRLNCEHEDVTRCPEYRRLVAEEIDSPTPAHRSARNDNSPATPPG